MRNLKDALDYEIKVAKACRACGSHSLKIALKLAQMPPGDKYVESPEQVPKLNLPSDIQFCNTCGHIQMSGFTNPDYIYQTYLSRPATTNPELKKVYMDYGRELKELSDGGGILEVGSNDGLFLEILKELDVNAVGIEPATNLSKFAQERNVNTVHGYVDDASVAKAISILGENPSVILANHSFSNVEDIQNWAALLTDALSVDGYLVVQTFYQLSVLENNLVENYNHEHLSYVMITEMSNFLGKYGMSLVEAKFISAKGGSIRLFFKKGKVGNKILSTSTIELLGKEELAYKNIESLFANNSLYIDQRREQLRAVLNEREGDIAAYGTSIGATVFSYQFGISDKISSFFDDDKLRQMRYSPGIGAKVLPGRSKEMHSFTKIIILAPLYADAIIQNNEEYLEKGGTFVRFWPEVEEIRKGS
jgi:hypothetical protein